MSDFNTNLPKNFKIFNFATTLTHDAIDASGKDGALDKLQSFKSSGVEGVGLFASLMKSGKLFSKSVPVLGNAISLYGAGSAYSTLTAEKAKPNPDPEIIKQSSRELFVNMADFVSPIGAPGTYTDLLYTGVKYTSENHEMLFKVSPEATEIQFESQAFPY